jgi:hypothetical protein
MDGAREYVEGKYRGLNLYLFDVDHTLEFAGGPITVVQLMRLREAGHVIGLCGNWGAFTQRYRGWWSLISLMSVAVDKVTFMQQVKTYCPGFDRYVMVGNDGDGVTVSADRAAAEAAGWEFVLERDFKEGL